MSTDPSIFPNAAMIFYQIFPRLPKVVFTILAFERANLQVESSITVGDPARARTIAKYLDHPPPTVETENPINPSLFELYSERGFLTLTGTYKSVPVSIVSIGMGAPNMDFFVREAREVLDESGEKNMVVIRFGSCGGLVSDLPVGSLTVPKAAVAITRNYDYDFLGKEASEDSREFLDAYRISKPLISTLRETLPSHVVVNGDYLNASADSFYSSQGRITSFPDHNENLIDHLVESGVGSLETNGYTSGEEESAAPPPPTNVPVEPFILPSTALSAGSDAEETILYPNAQSRAASNSIQTSTNGVQGRIIAAAVQMIFAERSSRAFISPQEVEIMQEGTAKGLLETLATILDSWRFLGGSGGEEESDGRKRGITNTNSVNPKLCKCLRIRKLVPGQGGVQVYSGGRRLPQVKFKLAPGHSAIWMKMKPVSLTFLGTCSGGGPLISRACTSTALNMESATWRTSQYLVRA
ncbi:3226_t:CDS:2 [Acaulospora colombiana]|uniref:3226_t:CDS:1 n=1 Tax=Acaulospora colombiana TaxID=27376 RepID=A0ACA9MUI2_9GLOM|nr:3226_t:CDS:2 [Acaulospora colombiana]